MTAYKVLKIKILRSKELEGVQSAVRKERELQVILSPWLVGKWATYVYESHL